MLLEADHEQTGSVNITEFIDSFLLKKIPPRPRFDRGLPSFCVKCLYNVTNFADVHIYLHIIILTFLKSIGKGVFNINEPTTHHKQGIEKSMDHNQVDHIYLPWHKFPQTWDIIILLLIAYALIVVCIL